jgi:hypothetical protein
MTEFNILEFRFLILDWRVGRSIGAPQTLILRLGGFVGGDHDGGEFVGFEKKRLDECFLHQLTFDDQLKPIAAFVGLFDDDSQLGDKLRLGSSSASSPIICPHRCCRANQLSSNSSPGGSLRQRTHQLHHPQRKRLRPLLQAPTSSIATRPPNPKSKIQNPKLQCEACTVPSACT